MRTRSVRGLTAAVLAVAAWVVIGAAAAYAKVGPDDPNAPYVTRPDPSVVVVLEPVSWTRYALVAALACLVGIAATLAVQLVVRHSRRTSMVHA
jgi:hypothetical protein